MKVFVPSLCATGAGGLLVCLGLLCWHLQNRPIIALVDTRLSATLQKELCLQFNRGAGNKALAAITVSHPIIERVEAIKSHQTIEFKVQAKNVRFCANSSLLILPDGNICPLSEINEELAQQLAAITVKQEVFTEDAVSQIFAWLYQLSDELLTAFSVRVINSTVVELAPLDGANYSIRILPCHEFDESHIEICQQRFLMLSDKERTKNRCLFDLRFSGQIIQTMAQ